MIQKKPVFIFIGLPGSGKDTQAEFLAQELGLPHLDAGSIFTSIVRNKGKYWEQIANTYKFGPISSELFIEILGEYFHSPICDKGFIFSQNTKSVKEITLLFRLLGELNFVVHKVFYLNVSPQIAIERCVSRLNGKFTEKEPSIEALELRVLNYVKIIDEIVDFYRNKDLLVEFDGTEKPETIFQNIKEFVQKGNFLNH